MMMTFFSPQARMIELDTIRGKYGINVILFKVYGTYVDINGNKSTFKLEYFSWVKDFEFYILNQNVHFKKFLKGENFKIPSEIRTYDVQIRR